MVNNTDVKTFLISAIQTIEKGIGLEEVDTEEQLINMALVYLYHNFEIGIALDSSEVVNDRTKILSDLKTVEEFIENEDLSGKLY